MESKIKIMNTRFIQIDIIKGISITLIVFGHIKWDLLGQYHLKIQDFIYSFHICIFFIIGGFLIKMNFRKYTFLEFLKKRIRQLLFPFFLTLLFYFLSNLLYHRIIFHKLATELDLLTHFPHTGKQTIYMKDILLSLVMANDSHFTRAGINGAFWFFPVYFCSNLFFWFLLKIKGSVKFLLLLLLPSLAFIMTESFGHGNIPWGINIAFFILPLMWIGTFFFKIEQFFDRLESRHKFIFFL